MIAGFVQHSPVFGDIRGNFIQVERLLDGVKADLLVLPELFATGYAFSSHREVIDLSEPAEGPTFQFLKELSVKTGAVIVAGFTEKSGNRMYNSAMAVNEQGLLGIYRKIHLFNREKEWFSPGDQPPPVIDLRGWKIGIMICFDWFFPETMRSLALRGAQVIAHPSNLVMPYCQTAMATRCLENRMFAITSNRIGREVRGSDDFTFTGMSRLTGIRGEPLLTGPVDEPAIGLAEIDPFLADDKTLNPFNDLLRDRRPDLYQI